MEPEHHMDDRTGRRRSQRSDSAYPATSFPAPPLISLERDAARVLPLRPRRSADSNTHTQAKATPGRDPLARISPPPTPALHSQPGLVRVAPMEAGDLAKPVQEDHLSVDLEDQGVPSTLVNIDTDRTDRPSAAPQPNPGSRPIRLSVRTTLSRVDLALSEGCTFAETLETVLDLCPQALQNNAVAHGGWRLRTAAGRTPDGESTLAAAGVLDGATLFLVGIDPGGEGRIFDDTVSYTHLRAHETVLDLVCRLLLEKKKK